MGDSPDGRGSVHPLFLNELDECPERSLGVDERHRGASAARPWRRVDRSGTRGNHVGERLGAVVDPVPDVVQALALALEELGDR